MNQVDILLDKVEWKPVPVNKNKSTNDLPYATHEGLLSLGGCFPDMKVYILNTGERIIDADDMQKFFNNA